MVGKIFIADSDRSRRADSGCLIRFESFAWEVFFIEIAAPRAPHPYLEEPDSALGSKEL